MNRHLEATVSIVFSFLLSVFFVLGVALLATSAAAAAQSATDVCCIILSNVFAQQAKEPNAQKAAEASMYFYLGRISATATAAQIKALFEAQGKTITNENAGTLMSDCAKAVQAKVELLESFSPKQPAAAQPKAAQHKPAPLLGRLVW